MYFCIYKQKIKKSIMSTILRNSYVFGPIISRRLGHSLGVNASPVENKICNFNCVYCECGWNNSSKQQFPTAQEIKQQLEEKLKEVKTNNIPIDVITFSGNGEPTLNPNFTEIIDETIKIRNLLYPNIKISVLSNATNLHNPEVLKALKKVDNPILKLDSAFDDTLNAINQPISKTITVEKIVSGMKQFNGNFILQIMFIKGTWNNKVFDNTTAKEINALLDIMKQTKPRQVMIYPIDRETPAKDLVKLDRSEMRRISKIIEEAGYNVLAVGI